MKLKQAKDKNYGRREICEQKSLYQKYSGANHYLHSPRDCKVPQEIIITFKEPRKITK